MLKNTLYALITGGSLILSGCGGGGGESGNSTSDISQLSLSFKTNLPAKVKVAEGDTLRLSVEILANRPGAVDYEWYFNNQKISVPSNTSTLLVRDITAAEQGQYRVVVRDVFRKENFITSLTSQVEVERKQSKPSFAQEEGEFNIIIGDDVTLNSGASGFPTPTYQWYKDGQLLAGQTGANLVLKNTKKTNSGLYHVIGKNSFGQTQSAKYQVNVELQLATGVWFGTLNKQQTLFAVAPNGHFVFNASSQADGVTFATGELRTTSNLEQGSSVRFHPKAEVPALIGEGGETLLQGDTTLSFGASGISLTPQSKISSRFVQINKPQQVTSSISFPQYEFAALDLAYDSLISNLITTPQDIAGTWQTSASSTVSNKIEIDQKGNLTGTLFQGNCQLRNGKILPAEDSKSLYTVEYSLVQPTGKNCPVALYNPAFKGLAFRIPDTTTGDMSFYMSSYFVLNKQILATHPLFLGRP